MRVVIISIIAILPPFFNRVPQISTPKFPAETRQLAQRVLSPLPNGSAIFCERKTKSAQGVEGAGECEEIREKREERTGDREQGLGDRDATCVRRGGEHLPTKGNAVAPANGRLLPPFSLLPPLFEPLTPDETKTAVFLSFGRKREKVGRKKRESLRTAKAATASALAARKSAVLFRLPRQKASTRHADGSALHMHQPCWVSNAAGISAKMHVPVECCAMPYGSGEDAQRSARGQTSTREGKHRRGAHWAPAHRFSATTFLLNH